MSITNEPTEAQVEAAAKAFYETPLGLTNWDRMADVDPGLARRYREAMARALVAAQGAAPQAECDCGAGPGSAVCKKVCATRATVLPSSGVDEDKLAEVIWQEQSDRVRDGYVIHTRETARSTARAVAEWLKGQGR